MEGERRVLQHGVEPLAVEGRRIDPSYHPTPAYEGAIRYSGFQRLATLWDEVGSVDLIVNTPLGRESFYDEV